MVDWCFHLLSYSSRGRFMDVLRSELHHVKQDQAGMVEDGSANQRPRGRRVSRVREAKKAWTTPPAREQCEPTFDFSPENDKSTPYLGHIHKSESSQVYIRKYKVLTLSIANIVCLSPLLNLDCLDYINSKFQNGHLASKSQKRTLRRYSSSGQR